MKRTAEVLVVFGAFALAPFARAGNLDVEIHCVPKKITGMATAVRDGHKSFEKEDWVYDVTIENKTFRDLVNLEVKYVIFYKTEHLGSKEPANTQRQKGSFTVPVLRAHNKTTLATEAVGLTTANLVGERHFVSGAKIRTQDTLGGLWVRIYQNGQLFAEYSNPAGLTQEKWE